MMLLIGLVTSLGICREIPEGMPVPDFKENPDDAVEITTTVGNMRNALWYYDFSIETWVILQVADETITEQQTIIADQHRVISEVFIDMGELENQYKTVRGIAIGTGIFSGLVIVGGITYAIIAISQK